MEVCPRKKLHSLIEQIDALENNKAIVKYRILATLEYIAKTPDNPDLELFAKVLPGFFDQHFKSMSFKELTHAYRHYHDIKSEFHDAERRGFVDGVLCSKFYF